MTSGDAQRAQDGQRSFQTGEHVTSEELQIGIGAILRFFAIEADRSLLVVDLACDELSVRIAPAILLVVHRQHGPTLPGSQLRERIGGRFAVGAQDLRRLFDFDVRGVLEGSLAGRHFALTERRRGTQEVGVTNILVGPHRATRKSRRREQQDEDPCRACEVG